MKSFKQFLLEQQNKVAVIAYGRYNPPTTGHQKLIDKVSNVAKQNNTQGFIIPSHTQKPKTDPLNFEEKERLLKYMVPDNVSILPYGKTLINLLQELQNQGYTNILHVAGSDRIPDYIDLVKRVNGKPDKTGNIPFHFSSYNFESAGERDPDSEGLEGMSASKLRKAALEDKFDIFKSGMSPNIPDELIKNTFDTIKARS